MKKIIIYVFVLSSLLTLSSCHTDSSNDSSSLADQFINHYVQEAEKKEEQNNAVDFEIIGSAGSYVIARDCISDVLYLWAKAGYAGGLTVMLDPDTGFPLTYTRYLELAKIDTPHS